MAGPVIVVDGGTEAAIQTALNGLRGAGTVIVPPVQYEIETTQGLVIRNDGVTLLGSGADQTVLFRAVDRSDRITYMVQSRGHAQVRVTGIRFEGFSPDSGGLEVGVLLENATDFRVDNSFFTHTGFAGVRTNGASSGVVDHCTFEDNYKPLVGTDGYGVVVYGIDAMEGEPFGSGRATFIEDSSFRLCRHAVAANKGARYVFRNNFVAQNEVAHAVDAHGIEYGSDAGTEWIDAHDNLIQDPSYVGPPCSADSAACFAVHIRGGKGLIWNNQFLQYNQGVHLRWDTEEPTGPVFISNNYLVVPEGSHSRCPDFVDSPMVCVVGTHGTPTYELSLPADYVPFPYPHPLTIASP